MSVVLATGGFDRKIRFWDAPAGRSTRIIKFADASSQINKIEISPDKQFIAAAGNPHILLYEILAGDQQPSDPPQQPALTLEGHKDNVTSIGFQKEGRYLFSGSEDGTIKIFDLRTANYSRSFDCGSAVNSVCLRYDRDELISGDANGNVKVWDVGGAGTGSSGKGCIHSVQASTIVTPTTTPLVQSPAATTTKRPPTLPLTNHSIGSRSGVGRTIPIQAVDISRDSRTLVAVSNQGMVYVWDPNGGAISNHKPSLSSPQEEVSVAVGKASETPADILIPITKFRAQPIGTYCLHARIAPDCRHLVTTGSDGKAKLWDTQTWELSQTLSASTKWVWDAAFCADSSYLVTASSDHVARLWNLRSGDVVLQYHGHQSTVTCVALNDSSV
jgi:target of rapamycin complex subunit LST8